MEVYFCDLWFDIVGWILGSSVSIGARIVFVIVALCALWCISLLFRDHTEAGDSDLTSSPI